MPDPDLRTLRLLPFAELFLKQFTSVEKTRGQARAAVDRVVFDGMRADHHETLLQVIEFVDWASQTAYPRPPTGEGDFDRWERTHSAIRGRLNPSGGPIPNAQIQDALHIPWSAAPRDWSYEKPDWMLIDAAVRNYERLVGLLDDWDAQVARVDNSPLP